MHIKVKGKTCRTLCNFDFMHGPDIFGRVNMSDIEIVQISIFQIELRELAVFHYYLSDTQDGLRYLRYGIYILWLTSYSL